MPLDPARELQLARLVYPLYHAVIERFELEMFPCRDLDQDPTPGDPEALNRIRLWFSEADKHIEVAHIRQYLQSNSVQEIVVRALIFRHLQKPEKIDSDRYKTDFLLGHYLAQNMPPDLLSPSDVKLSQVGQVLAPVLGDHGYLSFLEELEGCVRELQSCEHLEDLVERKILEKGKRLKAEAGARYFQQPAMIGFTRFNFLTRRFLIKLLATDLDEIGQALTELQSREIQLVDCSAAGLGASEPLAGLRERIKQWRKPFQGKYSEIEWLERISKLRRLLKAATGQQDAQRRPAPAASPETAPATRSEPAPAAAPVQSKPSAPAPAPAVEVPRPATPPAAAVATAAAKAPVASRPAAATPLPPKSKTSQKSFAAMLGERWERLYPPIQRLFEALRTQALGLWERVREALSERHEAPPSPPAAATPQAAPAPSKTPSGIIQPSAQVRDAIKRVSEQAATLPADADATLTVQDLRLSLNAREVHAFRRPHDNLSGILQRSVAVRLIVMEALKKAASADNINLNPILKFAYSELAMLQDRVTHARTNKDVDGAMQLSVCQRSLQSLIDQAESSLSHAGSPSR